MQKTTFIIISASYILKKGISYIINQLDNTLIYDELDKAEDLNFASPYHIPDFLVIDIESVQNKNVAIIKNFITKYNVEIICISDKQLEKFSLKCRSRINVYDTEEELKNKLLFCIKKGEKNDSGSIKKNEISKREKNVLQLVARGYTNKEIAEKLFISLHTVITHRKNITKKLGIKTVSGLTVYAILNNIIELNDIEK